MEIKKENLANDIAYEIIFGGFRFDREDFDLDQPVIDEETLRKSLLKYMPVSHHIEMEYYRKQIDYWTKPIIKS